MDDWILIETKKLKNRKIEEDKVNNEINKFIENTDKMMCQSSKIDTSLKIENDNMCCFSLNNFIKYLNSIKIFYQK
jgi:hypothetical protein